jgi:hypothetical protein
VWLTLLLAALLLSQTGPVVGVTVDNPFPNPGDTITITVCACLTPQGWNDSLELYIDGPDGHNVYHADLQLSDLPTTIAYTIPEDTPGGLYTVTVTWDHQYVQTGFTVAGQPVPESPFPFAVMLFAFTFATLAISRRKASASAPSLASHPRTYGVR